mmetsp:Transcript_5830/g.9727  ORF Transcript_5830/g.9727 Transcript_5830/m.9727 type:complete len:212 (-) Transcript_5830:14-649(-)|eukprot:CAMPEP_0197055530 /NCGR_PEP_ID=MMETSP1384-20130603/67387_1 /TAXON_ID=29189 /ORGANISM="Ammonia sp." /LENGTH=211 /DNA_ID=CAMNT_0042489143 /DNA_START=108 /DNA_END=743 /DNA_ORIENTATION=+
MFRLNQGQFYSMEAFQPSQIIQKIFTLQLIFYVLVSLFLGLIGSIGGISYSLSLLFDSTKLSFGFGEGYIPIVSFILSSFPCAYMVSWLIKRAKKCLDYVSTIYIIHLLLCWLRHHFPWNWDWWIVNFCSFLIMAVLSEYLCIRKEMKVIRLDHGIHVDDMSSSDDSDLDGEAADNKPLLLHQINKLNGESSKKMLKSDNKKNMNDELKIV